MTSHTEQVEAVLRCHPLPAWVSILPLGNVSPIVKAFVIEQAMGKCSRESALCAMVQHLARENAALHGLAEVLSRRPAPFVVPTETER